MEEKGRTQGTPLRELRASETSCLIINSLQMMKPEEVSNELKTHFSDWEFDLELTKNKLEKNRK